MKMSLFVFLGIVLLILLFLVFKPQNSQTISYQSIIENSQRNEEKNATLKINQRNFSLVIKNGKIVSGEKILSVLQGDVVTLTITTDVADEIHLHGYDISLDIQPNKSESIEFTADKTGRFSFELEHAEIDLGVIEVLPK